jgi:hypothetical protein
LTQEPTLEPELPICDAHHHLWEFRPEPVPYQRYLLAELAEDLGSGHNVRATVFIEVKERYRPDGPEEMRPVEVDAWAFARQGVITEGAGGVDVLSVDAWAKGMARPITFVQPFSPYSTGAFRIKGSAMAVVDGKELKGAEAVRLVKKLYEGALQHPKAAPLWREWCVE